MHRNRRSPEICNPGPVGAEHTFGGEGELRVETLVLVLTKVGITAAAGDGTGQTCGLAGLDRHDDDEADGQNDLNDR